MLALLAANLLSYSTATAESVPVTGATMWMSSDQLALSLHEPSLGTIDATDNAGMARAMSQAQAAARAQGGIAAPNNVPGGGGGGPWYQILQDQHDWAGNDTPTRNGDYSNFGYLKGTVAHNLFTLSAYRAAYSGYPKGSSRGNRLYVAWLVVQGYPKAAGQRRSLAQHIKHVWTNS